MAGYTSAPLNSFSIFRIKNYKNEQIKYAAFYPTDEKVLQSIKSDAQLSSRLDIEDSGGSIFSYFKMIRKWSNSISEEDLAIIHGHQPGSSIVGILALFSKRKEIPFVYTVHNSFTNFPLFKRVVLFLCFFGADAIIFVSKSAYISFAPYLPQKLLRKSIVIQNGVDMDRINKAISLVSDKDIKKDGIFRIACIGRLVSQKNLHFLIDVISKLNSTIQLDIYGEGELRSELQQKIDESNLKDQIILHGNVSRDDLFIFLKKSDLYVSVANYEGLPMAAMEALAIGKYCLLSDIDSHFEIQSLVPTVNICKRAVSKWAEEIESVINMNYEQREEVGMQNREYIEKALTMDKMQKKYTEVYKNVITKRSFKKNAKDS
jgi:glycosyltransferase involved in cell wall biosynthesis